MGTFIKDTDMHVVMLFFILFSQLAKREVWCKAGKRVGHYLAAILNLFVYQIRNSR